MPKIGNAGLNIVLLLLSASIAYISASYLHGLFQFAGMFLAGMLLGIFLMNIRLNVKNDKISSYKRELEKEAVSSSESEAKVKVLESKIEVLEKTLAKFLNK